MPAVFDAKRFDPFWAETEVVSLDAHTSSSELSDDVLGRLPAVEFLRASVGASPSSVKPDVPPAPASLKIRALTTNS